MRHFTKNLVLVAILLLFSNGVAQAQGCVAIRQMSTCDQSGQQNGLLKKGEIQLGSNFRYFKSFRHFRGHEEEPDRVANNTEVINLAYSNEFSITYGLSKRVSINASLPVVYNLRSSLYEHGRTSRHESSSAGIGDLRIGLGYWLFDPSQAADGNVSLGFGLKMPTGNFSAEDTFYNVGENGSSQVRPVDQSIQPGDGGWGLSVEATAFRKVLKNTFTYFNGFYLANPRETNGTRTFRETLSPLLINESIMSVADQYGLRAGLMYALPNNHFTFLLGGRMEGVPVRDLVGGSLGFRRPGQAVSIESGVNYMRKGWSFALSVPVSLYRNRPQSVTDLENQNITGQFRNGDAAFADYLINASINYRFEIKRKQHSEK